MSNTGQREYCTHPESQRITTNPDQMICGHCNEVVWEKELNDFETMRAMNSLAGQIPDTQDTIGAIIDKLESQEAKIAELTRKVEILKGLCQEHTKRIDSCSEAVASHTVRIQRLITTLDKSVDLSGEYWLDYR